MLIDIVTAVLGEPSERAVAVAYKKNPVGLLEGVRSAYERLGPVSPPAKEPGEFVPGVLSAGSRTVGNQSDPYFDVLARALLYSHRVAMRDPLYAHLYMREPWMPPEFGAKGLDQSLLRVIRWARLEEEHLLSYVVPDAHVELVTDPASGWEVLPDFPAKDLQDYFERFMSPRGRSIAVSDWSADVGPPAIARNGAAVELGHGLVKLEAALRWYALHRDSLDLFIPEDPLFRDAFLWLSEKGGLAVRLDATHEQDSATLSRLMRLPALSERASAQLSVGNLVELREETVFTRWREALQAATVAHALTEVHSQDPVLAIQSFTSELMAQKERVTARAPMLPRLKSMVGRPRTLALSVLGGAAASAAMADVYGGSAAEATATSIVGGLVPIATVSGYELLTGFVRQARALASAERHFALFASG